MILDPTRWEGEAREVVGFVSRHKPGFTGETIRLLTDGMGTFAGGFRGGDVDGFVKCFELEIDTYDEVWESVSGLVGAHQVGDGEVWGEIAPRDLITLEFDVLATEDGFAIVGGRQLTR